MRLVVFDLDGTLFNSTPQILKSFNAALQAVGEKTRSYDELHPLIGMPLETIYTQLLTRKSLARKACDKFRRYYNDYCKETRLFPGVRETIPRIKQRKVIATTKMSRLHPELMLRARGIFDQFDLVICGEDVERLKPAPDQVLLAMRRLDAGPGETLVVGDTWYDMAAAKAAGAWACGVTYGAGTRKSLETAGADFVINKFPQVKAVITKIEKA
jgi:HAD superfamily hydrolase (TIGR01549 family)